MSGVKGRSGGARENTGGARPGAGRKPKLPAVVASGTDDALKLLLDIAFGRIDATAMQVKAAVAAVQYTHTKRHDGGKKDEQAEKAKKVAAKFQPTAAPLKLVARG